MKVIFTLFVFALISAAFGNPIDDPIPDDKAEEIFEIPIDNTPSKKTCKILLIQIFK